MSGSGGGKPGANGFFYDEKYKRRGEGMSEMKPDAAEYYSELPQGKSPWYYFLAGAKWVRANETIAAQARIAELTTALEKIAAWPNDHLEHPALTAKQALEGE